MRGQMTAVVRSGDSEPWSEGGSPPGTPMGSSGDVGDHGVLNVASVRGVGDGRAVRSFLDPSV